MSDTTTFDFARWVEALRSGDYPQSRNFLRTTSGYCCLGVACDLVDHDGWEEPRVPAMYPPGGPPAPNIYYWRELDYTFPSGARIPELMAYRELSQLNDNGVPFEVIADVVERVPAHRLQEFITRWEKLLYEAQEDDPPITDITPELAIEVVREVLTDYPPGDEPAYLDSSHIIFWSEVDPS